MIRIYYGTPGAGKTYNALRDLLEELLYGTRLIVTNLPLNLGLLNSYCQRDYPAVDFGDINERIRIVTEEDTRTFYAFRSIADAPLAVPSKEDSLRGRHVNYDNTRPICYYIDEAHVAFDARNWDKTGPELTFYTSQHRKLSDECVFITQHPDMLERRLRMLAQQFWSHQNNALERFMTIFRKPSYFHCRVYRHVPAGTQTPPPEESRVFTLDLALAACYDTSAGIGISGRKMPEKPRKKGLPVWLLLIPIIAAVYLLMKAPGCTADFLIKSSKGGTEALKDIAPAKPSETGAPSPTGGPRVAVESPPSPKVVPVDTVPVFVQSYALRGGEAIVTLTDGRTLTKATGLLLVTKDYVLVSDGSRYYMQRGAVQPRLERKKHEARAAAQPPPR